MDIPSRWDEHRTIVVYTHLCVDTLPESDTEVESTPCLVFGKGLPSGAMPSPLTMLRFQAVYRVVSAWSLKEGDHESY